MGAAERMRTVEDSTPLNGDTIDVGARIAWTVRMARLTADPGIDNRLRTLADLIGSSPAHLSRVETGQRRDGAVIDGYERVFGMPRGSLRAAIEVLCRTFPHSSPRDLDPGHVIRDVATLSALTASIESGRPVKAGEWLAWASAMAQDGNIGLPAPQMYAIVVRLISELARSQGHPYPVRYEALARLRSSAYGAVVLDAVKAHAARPYAAGLYDVLSAAAECNTPDAVEWFLTLLEGEDEGLAVGGALALENLGAITGPEFWGPVAARIVAVSDTAEPGSPAATWSAHLLRLIPAAVRPALSARPTRPLPPAVTLPTAERGPDNHLWVSCVAAAHDVTRGLGLTDQPMLARLLYDIAFGHWETRAVTSYMLLDALPRVSDRLGAAFATLLDTVDDEAARDRILRRVSYSLFAHDASMFGEWIDSDIDSMRQAAFIAAGPAGIHLPAQMLLEHAGKPGFARATLYSAGMSSHPVLGELATRPEVPERVRVSAAWWRDAGGMLRD